MKATPYPALLALACLMGVAPAQSAGERWWGIGPMLHWEFGEHAKGVTFGIEASYWWLDGGPGFPAGFDVGVEFTKTRLRFYTEGQAGALVGISAGPYVELPYASEARSGEGSWPRFGVQTSLWGWWLAGADLRLRLNFQEEVFSPGLFGKLGSCLGSCSFH